MSLVFDQATYEIRGFKTGDRVNASTDSACT